MANPLRPIAEQSSPHYDRNSDIVWFRGVDSNAEDEFARSIPDLRFRRNKQQGGDMIFFKKIPLTIRRRIYSFVFEYPANGKQVNLSKDFTTKEVFPPDFFITPWDLLHQVAGGLGAGIQMRDELYTYFWNTYHFHVTFSPYSLGAVFSGLSIRLLNAYANRVNHLTVEVDMTKLAFSAASDAKLLKQSNRKLQKVLVDLVIALGHRRHKGNVMASLTLLARRYIGFRPEPAGSPEKNQVPYCPDKALFIFSCFCELRPLVLQCRMSGFSIWYTRQLLKEILIPPFLTKPRPAPIIPAWPHYTPIPLHVEYLSNISTIPEESSTVESTSGGSAGSTSDTHHISSFPNTIPSFGYSQASSSAGSLLPPNTQRLAFYQVQKDLTGESAGQGSGDARNATSASPFISNVRSNGGTQCAGSNSLATGLSTAVENLGSKANTVPMLTPGALSPPCASASATKDAQIPTSDADSFVSTPSSTSTGRISVRSFGSLRSIAAAETGIPTPRRGTARSFRSRHGYMITEAGASAAERRNALSLGLGISLESRGSSSFTNELGVEMTRANLPSRKDSLPGAAKSPSTIQELNYMNEMDPAFTRAIEGLRMASDSKEKDAPAEAVADEVAQEGESNKKGKKEKTKKKKTSRKHWF